MPAKQPKRRPLWLGDGSCIWLRPTHRNHVWSYDFVMDRTADGRVIRMLTIVDEFTRECSAIDVSRKLTSEDVLERVSGLFVRKGVPDHIRSDNGSEFTATRVREWLGRVGVKTLYIEPGSPWENGYIESFNGKLRDELLAREVFDTLLEAKVLIERWRKAYNTVRPHSSLGYRPPAPESRRPCPLASALCLERLRCDEQATLPSPRPRVGAVSFLHRFGSGLNRHAHLHAAVTDGVFLPGPHGPDGPPAFLPARPLTQGDLAALTERVRRRVIAFFKRQGFLNAHAAADMLAWENSGFSVDASVRITLTDRDVPSYFQSLEHLLRYCARPPFALERLSVIRDEDGRATKVRYVMPRHKAAGWVGPGRKRKSTQPGANGVVELTPFEFLDRLADLVPPPRKHRHRYHGVFAPNHPLRPAVTALAVGNGGKRRDAATGGHADGRHAAEGCCNTHEKPRSHDTSRIAWAKLMARVGEKFPLECPACGGDIRLIAFITEPGSIRKILTHLGEPLVPPPISPARGPPTEWHELVQVHDDGDVFQASPDELPAIDIHSL